jgi:hypothetical protein
VTNNGIQKNEEADRLLFTLFHKTLHSWYFAKLPFGSKDKFEKMPNTILPLVVLTWLRQLQEHFYKIGDNKESGDWNVHGKYCAVRAKNVSKDFPLDNVHMMKANSTSLVKVDSVTYIKPNGKPHKTVVKSLEEWAAKILCRNNNDYVQNIANSDDKTKNASKGLQSMGQRNMLCRKHPTNQPMRRQVTALILSSLPHNNNETKLQSNCFCMLVIS